MLSRPSYQPKVLHIQIQLQKHFRVKFSATQPKTANINQLLRHAKSMAEFSTASLLVLETHPQHFQPIPYTPIQSPQAEIECRQFESLSACHEQISRFIRIQTDHYTVFPSLDVQ